MILCKNNLFKLDTPNTTYMFRVSDTGHPEHLYYGPYLPFTGDLSCYEICTGLRMPTIVNYADSAPRTYLTMLPLETSSFGKGDLREAAFVGELGEIGNTVFDFRFVSFRIEQGNTGTDAEDGYPHTRKNNAETLIVLLTDPVVQISLELSYSVYADSDVIVRKSRIFNNSAEVLTIRALYSLQLDIVNTGFEAISFDGAWIRERELHRTALNAGTFSISSTAGISSAEHNPLFLLKSGEECYLFNLLWSGDHREAAEVSPYGTIRVLTGLNPASFSLQLSPGESFASPEAIMAYSSAGENGISHIAHEFLTEYVTPLNWKNKERPILLNSWEGMGFDLSESNILKQAESARALGIELFVIDDGWFRKGFCAKGSMGDWTVDRNKFPNGLRPVCDAIHSLGMMAGIWVEPEMISPDTELYSQHPDFLVRCPGRDPSPGRDQYLLDISREEVTDILFSKLEKLIAENDFDYIKWDMNRYLSDDYSDRIWIPEFRYRWVLGLYRLLRRITERFPHLLIEGCASGGGRFDPGILCYVNQFWGSDNTDATSRVSIFSGTAYGYPQSVFGAHVSRIPNGITGRVYDYETAFHVNAFGAFGYELDVTKLSDTERETVRAQIGFYRKYRKIFQFGRFSQISSSDGNTVTWTVENEDASVILAMMLEKRMTFSQTEIRRLRVPSCSSDALYRVTARQQTVSAPEMCERRGGVHRSPEFTRLVSGALLNGCGMTLMPVFLGTEYKEDTVYLGDYGSLMFVIEKVNQIPEVSL